VRRRTLSREFVLKALYAYDLLGGMGPAQVEAIREMEGLAELDPYARELLDGCIEHRPALDEVIQATAENWRLDRMPIVDRNILRIATYELVCQQGVPPKVAINEAIELAKKYSTENSASFVNGVLDKIYANNVGAQGEGADVADSPKGEATGALAAVLQSDPDPLRKADLHVHSTASDGSLTPPELVQEAARRGMAAVALVDHDTVQGIAAARRAAEGLDIIVVPGIELTAYARNDESEEPLEVHLIGLFIDESAPNLLGELNRLQDIRVRRVHEIARKLQELGVDIRAEEVLERYGGESVGRVHIATELVRAGRCKDVREAFDRYLAVGGPAYVPKERLTPPQAIALIHGAGGCAVLAHPGVGNRPHARLGELKEAGLDGIEVHYPGHSVEDEKAFLDAARRYDLAVSGGSDFHGEVTPEVEVGTECVSFAEVKELAERAARWRENPRVAEGASANAAEQD